MTEFGYLRRTDIGYLSCSWKAIRAKLGNNGEYHRK